MQNLENFGGLDFKVDTIYSLRNYDVRKLKT